MDLEKAVELAKDYLGKEFFEPFALKFILNKEINGLKVSRKNNLVIIEYNELIHLFRGLSLVKEKQNETNYEISLNPSFDSTGLMLDCSRNGVVTVDEVKKIILIQALMGDNRLLLYTEDTYEMDEYPYFGYLRGAYSKEDLKEIVSFGESFGVELVPCIQTLDHLAKPLRWDVFDNVRDSMSNVMVNNEETYKFLETMIKTCRECFPTKHIHIGMDESFLLGLGKYLYQNGYHDRVSLFCEHLSRVIKICKKYDFNPMIWSDMFFRLNSPDGEYYSCTHLPEETIKMIPSDVELVYWDYYHDEKAVYDRLIDVHLKTKRVTHFAGGAWRWGGFATSLQKSYEFNKIALESCKEKDIKNVFITSWGDNGNECSIYSALLSLAQYSAFNYLDNPTDKDVNSLLYVVTGETKERMLLMDLPNMPAKKVLSPTYNPSKYFFYQDLLLGMFDSQVKDEYAPNYGSYVSVLNKAAKESIKFSYIYKNLANLCDVLSLKTDMGVRLRKAYKANDRKTLQSISSKEIPLLVKRIKTFRDSLEEQWMKENRPFGFDVLDGRIGYLLQRVLSAKNRVELYLSNKIKAIDELEKEILPYSGHDYEICWNNWETTVAI